MSNFIAEDEIVFNLATGFDPVGQLALPATHPATSTKIVDILWDLHRGNITKAQADHLMILLRGRDPVTLDRLPPGDIFLRREFVKPLVDRVRSSILSEAAAQPSAKIEVELSPEIAVAVQLSPAYSVELPRGVDPVQFPDEVMDKPFDTTCELPAPFNWDMAGTGRFYVKPGSYEEKFFHYLCCAMYYEAGYTGDEIGAFVRCSGSYVRTKHAELRKSGYVWPSPNNVPPEWRVWPRLVRPHGNAAKYKRGFKKWDDEHLFVGYVSGWSIEKISEFLSHEVATVEEAMLQHNLVVTDIMGDRTPLTDDEIANKIDLAEAQRDNSRLKGQLTRSNNRAKKSAKKSRVAS